jgi:hypothetical protein
VILRATSKASAQPQDVAPSQAATANVSRECSKNIFRSSRAVMRFVSLPIDLTQSLFRMGDKPRLELAAGLFALFQSRDWSDLVLFSHDGSRYPVHRAIVCPRSHFFDDAVRRRRWRVCRDHIQPSAANTHKAHRTTSKAIWLSLTTKKSFVCS